MKGRRFYKLHVFPRYSDFSCLKDYSVLALLFILQSVDFSIFSLFCLWVFETRVPLGMLLLFLVVVNQVYSL